MYYYIIDGFVYEFPTALGAGYERAVSITQQEYNDVRSGTASVENNVIVYPAQPTQAELLEQAKLSKRMQIETAYHDALESGYLGNYRAHDKQRSEYAAQLQLLETAKQLQQVIDSTPVTWYGKDGAATQPLSAFRVWCLQYGLWAQSVINTYYLRINAIKAATTISEVENVVW